MYTICVLDMPLDVGTKLYTVCVQLGIYIKWQPACRELVIARILLVTAQWAVTCQITSFCLFMCWFQVVHKFCTIFITTSSNTEWQRVLCEHLSCWICLWFEGVVCYACYVSFCSLTITTFKSLWKSDALDWNWMSSPSHLKHKNVTL